ncbi:glycosyltransferase family 4 protein [Wenyingzhuangia sp. IMCC45574]
MRICITRTKKTSYSETFIKDQIDGFSKFSEVFTVHTSRFPERSEDGKLLSPYFFWIMHKVIKGIVGRNNFFSNYGMKKFLDENKIDVVLCNYGTTGSHMVPVCKALNIPLVVIFHGHDATEKKILKKYLSKYRTLFNYNTRLIAVSQEIKRKLVSYGAESSKIEVIPCGVDITRFKPDESITRKNQFLSVGRFAVKKGPLYTIKAFKEVVKKYPEARLIMAGSKGGLYPECVKLVEALGIEKNINFTGVLKPTEVSELMKSSIAFVQHSITAPNGDMEGTPVSIMEASASCLPIISTKHGGINDVVVHGVTGFLVDEKDVEGMSNYMLRLYEDRKEAEELGEKARIHIKENYLQSKQIEKINNLAMVAINS